MHYTLLRRKLFRSRPIIYMAWNQNWTLSLLKKASSWWWLPELHVSFWKGETTLEAQSSCCSQLPSELPIDSNWRRLPIGLASDLARSCRNSPGSLENSGNEAYTNGFCRVTDFIRPVQILQGVSRNQQGFGKARSEPKLLSKNISIQSSVFIQWFPEGNAIFSLSGIRGRSQLPIFLVLGELKALLPLYHVTNGEKAWPKREWNCSSCRGCISEGSDKAVLLWERQLLLGQMKACYTREKQKKSILPTCTHRSDKVPPKGKGSGTPLLLDRIEAILCGV